MYFRPLADRERAVQLGFPVGHLRQGAADCRGTLCHCCDRQIQGRGLSSSTRPLLLPPRLAGEMQHGVTWEYIAAYRLERVCVVGVFDGRYSSKKAIKRPDWVI